MPRFVRFSRSVHTWNRWKCIFFDWDECSVCNLRVAAFRRWCIAANPSVHIGDHRAPEIADGQWRLWLLAKQISFALGRRKGTRKMLKSREMVNPDVRRDCCIPFPIGGDVNQRRRASPVFIGSVGKENLRYRAAGRTVEQPSLILCHRINFGLVGERENVRGEKRSEEHTSELQS